MKRIWALAGWLTLGVGCDDGRASDPAPPVGEQIESRDAGCRGAACCAPDETYCSGKCIDVSSSSKHCGECGNSCASDALCEDGACVQEPRCEDGQLECAGACVDPRVDALHCGSCEKACDDGQRCNEGECACPAGTVACGNACVDTQASDSHCGACNEACPSAQSCIAGACACPPGRTLCGDQCADTQTSAEHCGACGKACMETQVCTDGTCRWPLGADGCADAAGGVSISGIDVYQTVRVPLLANGMAVQEERRNADVVAGRAAVFRVAVDLDMSAAARELSARVTVHNGAGEDTYFTKQRLPVSAMSSSPAGPFAVDVPADRVQAETTYSVEIVECGTAQGSKRSPRYPATGEVALEARETGKLKVVFVPVRANGRVPELTPAISKLYADYLKAMYPITDVEFSMSTEISTRYPLDWSWMLDQLRAKRRQEAPGRDVYYYGLVQPVPTWREFCPRSCTTGMANITTNAADASGRVGVGISYGDANSASNMAHELGHAHGRYHSPCGNAAGPDSRYPYNNGGVGVWGYDLRKDVFINPSSGKDVMSYCEPKWISDYTYQALVNRVAAVNAVGAAEVDTRPLSRWQVILVGAHSARWGHHFTQPDHPFGVEESAEILARDGTPIATVPAYRSQLADGDDTSSTLLVPEPDPGWYAVRLRAHGVPVELAFEGEP